jgi:hypothetical protein
MPMRGVMNNSRPKRLKDFSIYILVSVICVASIIAAAVEGVPEQKFMPWFGFALFTSFLFGQFILKSRRVWEKKSFWLVTGLFLLMHVVTFTKLLHAGREVSGGEWLLLVVIEMAVLIIFRKSVYGA